MPLAIPDDVEQALLRIGEREVRVTNLRKLFWPQLGLTKRDLLRYYAQVSPFLLPHLSDRPIVMKRYPDGVGGAFFFMKRAPQTRPAWIRTCEIDHGTSGVIAFPVIDDLASLMWVVNLGCIDLNQWYGRCDDPDRPDYVHFDLDPGDRVPFSHVRDAALVVRSALEQLRMAPIVKTSGSKGLHVYVPIIRGPIQKQVWTFAKALAVELARRHPALMTAEYRRDRRPPGRVLVDYNQNAWGRTLASVYSVRPTSRATVSMPVTWDEVEEGVEIDEFRVDTAPARLMQKGDLWKPLLVPTGRTDLTPYVGT